MIAMCLIFSVFAWLQGISLKITDVLNTVNGELFIADAWYFWSVDKIQKKNQKYTEPNQKPWPQNRDMNSESVGATFLWESQNAPITVGTNLDFTFHICVSCYSAADL